jgi:hypothetical protein
LNQWRINGSPLLAQIAVSKHSEHMPLNRQAVVMARHGVPIDRSVLADWMGRTGALIAPVVDRMAVLLKQGSTRLYVPSRACKHALPGNGRNHRPGSGPRARLRHDVPEARLRHEDRLSLGGAAR